MIEHLLSAMIHIGFNYVIALFDVTLDAGECWAQFRFPHRKLDSRDGQSILILTSLKAKCFERGKND